MAEKPAEHPGKKLFTAIEAGLNWQNAHYDEYLAADLANDPAIKGASGDPEISKRIKRAMAPKT